MAYAVTAIAALALQSGWGPHNVLTLAATLLVLIGFVISADDTRPH